MNKAWMIRNDGKAIPVDVHIYGNEEAFIEGYDVDYEDLQETVEAAVWLYDNTRVSTTKNLCIEFIALWLDNATLCNRVIERIPLLLKMIDSGEIYSSRNSHVTKFIRDNEAIINAIPLSDADEDTLISKAQLVCYELDQEFLRARLGGAYDSYNSDDLYFRISSTGYNWFDIIWNFTYEQKPKTVTVVRDYESTGNDGFLVYKGEPIDKMSFDKFITLPGNPVLESSKNDEFAKLSSGLSLLQIYVNKNSKRICGHYKKLQSLDSAKNYTGHYLSKLEEMIKKARSR